MEGLAWGLAGVGIAAMWAVGVQAAWHNWLLTGGSFLVIFAAGVANWRYVLCVRPCGCR